MYYRGDLEGGCYPFAFVQSLLRGAFATLVLFLLSGATTALAFTAKTVGDVGNVTVMEVEGNYDAKLPDGTVNSDPRRVIASEFFRTHRDNYDFLVIFSNFDFAMPAEKAAAFYHPVKNDIQGIGQAIFDNTSYYGSAGVLQGTVDMGNLAKLGTSPLDAAAYDYTLDVLAHEIFHRWGANVRFVDASGNLSTALLTADEAHWSYLLDSDGSLEYGNDWRDNGDGTFTSMAVRKYFSPLDRYLMGMIVDSSGDSVSISVIPGIQVQSELTQASCLNYFPNTKLSS